MPVVTAGTVRGLAAKGESHSKRFWAYTSAEKVDATGHKVSADDLSIPSRVKGYVACCILEVETSLEQLELARHGGLRIAQLVEH